MRDYQIVSRVTVFSFEELNDEEKELVEVAREMTQYSYAPYSRFYVGAALRLKNGVLVRGCNQENAASPSGVCAERSAIFSAGAQYPDQPVVQLAIAARNENGFMEAPIPPCGACRQVILETESRFNQPIRIYLVSRTEIHVVDTINALLPLQFVSESMQ